MDDRASPALHPRGRVAAMAVAVAAAAALLYLGTLAHGFAFDDALVVEQNPLVREHRFAEAFATPYHHGPGVVVGSSLYRPLTVLSVALGHAVHGARPAGYHAVNLLLHAAVSVLVLLLALSLGLGPPAALAGALLFAAHPVHAEAVAAISGRSDLLSGAFFLLSLLAYVRLREGDGPLRRSGLSLACAALLLAILSKESAATLVGVVAAWELLVRRRRGERPRDFLRRHAPELARHAAALLAIVGLYLLVRRAVIGSLLLAPGATTFVENPTVGQPLLVRWGTAAAAAGRALGLLFLPIRLSPDYGYAATVPVTSPLDPALLASIAAGIAVALAIVLALKRSGVAAFLILFPLLAYSIVSNFLFPVGTILAERLLYLPSVGICLLAGGAWAWLFRRSRTAAIVLLTLLLLAASVRTLSAAAAWRDDLTLFESAHRSTPDSVKVLGNLAAELALRGRLEEARPLLERAIELAPALAPLRINLAGVLLKQGDIDGAEREIAAVLEQEPANAVALLQWSVAREKRGDREGAFDAARRAVAAQPGLEEARRRLEALGESAP